MNEYSDDCKTFPCNRIQLIGYFLLICNKNYHFWVLKA
ncbi:hypothetical protein LPE509_03028 [Legionella pneumophila subsp. pneumophila LPE509]|nr:hypothetical protein LPE509_03028 [Legionella pneumophila subsp. pneumophila LPE509]